MTHNDTAEAPDLQAEESNMSEPLKIDIVSDVV